MQFPVDEFLEHWQAEKPLAHEKYAHTLLQLPYRLNWFSERRDRKPEINWPTEVRMWEHLCTSLHQNSPAPASPYDAGQIRDFLLALTPSSSTLVATSNSLPQDLSPQLFPKFSWFDGCALIDASTYAFYATHLSDWLHAHHDAHPSTTSAAAMLFTYVLRMFYARPLLKLCRHFYAQLPPEEIVRRHIAEGHSEMTVLKITRMYTQNSTLKEIKAMIDSQSSGR